MRVGLVRRPGQDGTKAYVEQYGDRLICVRYRYDEAARKRYKTIELVVDEAPWEPKAKGQTEQPPPFARSTLVGIRLEYEEHDLRQLLLSCKAGWLPQLKLWVITYAQAQAMDLSGRILGTIAELTEPTDKGRP